MKQNSMGINQKRVIKFTTCSLINIDGNMDMINYNQNARKRGKRVSFPVFKNELIGRKVCSVSVVSKEPTLSLTYNLQENKTKMSSRTYFCDNLVIRD